MNIFFGVVNDNQNVQISTKAVITVTVLILIALFVYGLPLLITEWRLFEKAHKHGWAILIPVYSTLVLGEIGKKPLWMGLSVGILNIVSSFIPFPIGTIISIYCFVVGLILLVAFIKAYRANTWFWLSFFFIPWVAVFTVKNVTHKNDTALITDTNSLNS